MMLPAALVFLFAAPISAMAPLPITTPSPPPQEGKYEPLSLIGFTEEPGWLNLNISRVPSIPYPGQTVSVAVFSLSNYYHKLMSPQFVCRFTSKTNPSQTFVSDYARLRPIAKGDPCFVIDCPLQSVASWKIKERTAVVSVLYRSKLELKYIGKEGDDTLTFLDSWTSFEYNTLEATILIRGQSLNPDHKHSAKFALENGQTFTVLARPASLDEITFNLSKHVDNLKEEVSARITLFTTQGLVPYDGDKGSDTVVLESPVKHVACKTHRVVDQPWRKVSNQVQSPLHCDNSDTQGVHRSGWNRIAPSIGGRLPQECPPIQRCGASYTGWLRNAPPTKKGVEVSNVVCWHRSSNCCYHSSTVKVINCGPFLVYYLPSVPVCNSAYCGDA